MPPNPWLGPPEAAALAAEGIQPDSRISKVSIINRWPAALEVKIACRYHSIMSQEMRIKERI
jgi:hypothetical protein